MSSAAPLHGALAEGVPTPCLHCGAPMKLGEAPGLHASPELACEYCGRREALPAETAQLHRHLRVRLMQVERARAATEAPLATYRAVQRAFVPAFVVLILVAGVPGLMQLARAPAGSTVTLVQLAPLALFVGMACGWVGMLLKFRELVQPLLRARAPLHPGLPARCRACGGELPPARSTHVACTYCKTDNLLDEKLTAQVSELLRRESDEYFARARGERKDVNAYSKPSQAFYVWGAVGTLATLAAMQVLTMLG